MGQRITISLVCWQT